MLLKTSEKQVQTLIILERKIINRKQSVKSCHFEKSAEKGWKEIVLIVIISKFLWSGTDHVAWYQFLWSAASDHVAWSQFLWSGTPDHVACSKVCTVLVHCIYSQILWLSDHSPRLRSWCLSVGPSHCLQSAYCTIKVYINWEQCCTHFTESQVNWIWISSLTLVVSVFLPF